jgi:PIN domain nuclease of toxin-antitoxin system
VTYVLDTHAVVWYLANDPRASAAMNDAMGNPSSLLVIPSIVLAELWHLSHRHRIAVT